MAVQVFDGDGKDQDEADRRASELRCLYPIALRWGATCTYPTIVDACNLASGSFGQRVHSGINMTLAFDASAVQHIYRTALGTCGELLSRSPQVFPEINTLRQLFTEELARA